MNCIIRFLHISKIAKKMLKRVLIIELVCFFVVTLLSFLILRPMLEEQSMQIANAVHTRIAITINSSLESITAASQFIATSKELKEELYAYQANPTKQTVMAVNVLLNHMASSQPNIKGVVLDSRDGIKMDSFFMSNVEEEIFDSDWYRHIYNVSHSSSFSLKSQTGEYVLVYSNNCYIGTHNYILSIFYDANYMLSEARVLSDPMFQNTIILDQNATPIYESSEIEFLDNNSYNMLGEMPFGNYRSSSGVYFVDTLQTNMWQLVSFANKQSISLSYRSYLAATLLLFIFLCFCTMLMVASSINSMIAPLSQLNESMGDVTEGNMKTSVIIESDDEIGELSQKFNSMVKSIKAYIKKVVDHEQIEQKMKYSLLISQIDPHFIYNTMGLINILAKSDKNDDIVAINTALIRIMQDRLRIKDIEFYDSIKQEVEMVKQYLVIQSYRYDNNVRTIWEVNEDALAKSIPKNILQPLVENALFHGLMDENSGIIEGEIRISIGCSDCGIYIQVHDNGRGISREVLEQLNCLAPFNEIERGRNIGLRNIKERLAYLYPSKDCLKIENDNGATVTILLQE